MSSDLAGGATRLQGEKQEERESGTMTVMGTVIRDSDVTDVARAAGLTPKQTAQLRNIAASWAMEGIAPTIDDLRIDAELIAGRIDAVEAKRRLGL